MRSSEKKEGPLAKTKSKKKPTPAADALKRLGTFIKSVRKARRLSQSTLAELSGVGLNFISQIEAGKESAHIGKILMVLASLGLQIKIESGSQMVAIGQEKS